MADIFLKMNKVNLILQATNNTSYLEDKHSNTEIRKRLLSLQQFECF